MSNKYLLFNFLKNNYTMLELKRKIVFINDKAFKIWITKKNYLKTIAIKFK